MTRSALLIAFVLGIASAQQSEVETTTSAARQALKEVDKAPPAQRAEVANRAAEALLKLPVKDETARAIVQAEALHLFVHAGQMEKVFSGAGRLSPSDPAWKRVLPVLLEASERQNNYTDLARIASALQEQAPDSSTRQLAAVVAGEALWQTGKTEQARSAFEAAARIAPESATAAGALLRLKELTELAPGSPAPEFTLAARDGAVLSKASARGKVALLYFWASWCASCKEHIPLFAGLKDIHRDRLLLVGISLDADCDVAGKWANSAGITWPTACDGKGEDGPVAKAFAVGGASELVLIARQGSLAGKNVPYDRLRAVVAELVEEPRAGRYSQEFLRESRSNLPEIFSALAVRPGSRVADVGAGDGFLTLRLARAVGPAGMVYAADIDEKAIGQLRKRAALAGLENVVSIRSAPSDPMLPTDTLDGAIMLLTYHEVVPYREMLARILSALRPGGRLVVIDPAPPRERRERTRAEQVANHELDLDIVKNELVEAGFNVIRSTDRLVPSGREEERAMWLIAAERPSGRP